MAEMIQDSADLAMREHHKNASENTFEQVTVTKNFDGEELEITYRKQPVSAGFRTDYYAPFEPGTSIVNGLIYERDVPVTLRDGRVMYTDIYRPQNAENIPVILAWTPFGKRHWYGAKEAPGLHQAMGVPRGTISQMAAFEGADPSYWCDKGYAVANVDIPGVGYSEGDCTAWTQQYGKDGYDFVEWIAAQSWCNGKVGMAGNSGLAAGQWFVAAEQPPHLAAIAPWEGFAEPYRDWVAPGGIPYLIFAQMIYSDLRGPGLFNHPEEMINKYPLINGYWEDQKAHYENIKCPAYVTAGWAHPFHLRSSVLAFEQMKSKNKWIRFHREFEWPDFNDPENIEDLRRFFDRYLRGIHNGWEMTPKVRLEVTDAYDCDAFKNRPEKDFPIPRTEYKKYYLNAADGSMGEEQPENEATVSYDPATGEAMFTYYFTEDTEITGHSKLRFWISVDEGKEADVFITVRKVDKDGNLIPTSVFGEPDPGFVGKLRASHRELDPKKSTESIPYHTHRNYQPLTPGEPVPLDVEIWPNSKLWHKGEGIQVSVSGHMIRDENWFLPTIFMTENEGNHIIHTGGKYDCYYLAPVIPPKHVSGDFVFRG